MVSRKIIFIKFVCAWMRVHCNFWCLNCITTYTLWDLSIWMKFWNVYFRYVLGLFVNWWCQNHYPAHARTCAEIWLNDMHMYISLSLMRLMEWKLVHRYMLQKYIKEIMVGKCERMRVYARAIFIYIFRALCSMSFTER